MKEEGSRAACPKWLPGADPPEVGSKGAGSPKAGSKGLTVGAAPHCTTPMHERSFGCTPVLLLALLAAHGRLHPPEKPPRFRLHEYMQLLIMVLSAMHAD